MTTQSLREALTDIFFRAAGGISDMAEKETEAAMKIINEYTEAEKQKAELKGAHNILDIITDALDVIEKDLREKKK
jgi:hypothetical protein